MNGTGRFSVMSAFVFVAIVLCITGCKKDANDYSLYDLKYDPAIRSELRDRFTYEQFGELNLIADSLDKIGKTQEMKDFRVFSYIVDKELKERTDRFAHSQEIDTAVNVIVTNKEVKYDEGITLLSFRFTSNSKKEISGFSGVILVMDQYGSVFFNYQFNYPHFLRVGETKETTLQYDFDKYSDQQNKINALSYSQMKFKFECRSLTYADGSKIYYTKDWKIVYESPKQPDAVRY
jgi:hypothetical protein